MTLIGWVPLTLSLPAATKCSICVQQNLILLAAFLPSLNNHLSEVLSFVASCVEENLNYNFSLLSNIVRCNLSAWQPIFVVGHWHTESTLESIGLMPIIHSIDGLKHYGYFVNKLIIQPGKGLHLYSKQNIARNFPIFVSIYINHKYVYKNKKISWAPYYSTILLFINICTLNVSHQLWLKIEISYRD